MQPVHFSKYRSKVVATVWLAIVLSGMCVLARHSSTPGPVIHTDRLWPVGNLLFRQFGTNTLVIALHPECPCSRASLIELEGVMTRCRGHLKTIALFAAPAGLKEDSASTELWQSASHINGVSCVHDLDGRLSARFGASTSGQVFLYDTHGVLQFHGGITASRGHAGDNDGVNAIAAIINNQEPATRQTPVFGCSLH